LRQPFSLMTEHDIEQLISRMTLAEKLGQMTQVQPHGRDQEERVRQGGAGSLINVVGDDAYHYQWLAVEHSRLGIPLLLGRDVIHGFQTVFPIPLGQAAAFDPERVRQAAAHSAREAGAAGVNWTFSPMLDVARDPRWGRIAESFGEDPLLISRLGVAMVQGYQQEGVAACAKHFVGYGAAEGGRDYSATDLAPRALLDTYLPPFLAAQQAGVMTVMSAFNDLDGVPATGHEDLIRGTLKNRWGFDGLVVSDWCSVTEMIAHGFCEDAAAAARAGVSAGVDMEMASTSYLDHMAGLIEQGLLDIALVDDAVRRILRIKARLGLFQHPYGDPGRTQPQRPVASQLARSLARDSCVLLKNEQGLPLGEHARRVAVIGPLADAPGEQLGCWVFDGERQHSQTVFAALQERLGAQRVVHARGLEHCRSHDLDGLEAAVALARSAEVVVLCLGEDAGLSGEAHCRAHLDLPGAQQTLLEAVAATGVPVVLVIMAGRPLVLGPVLPHAQAVLYAWHPGSQGGPAIVDLLCGESPSGRLPVSFPRSVGQIPIFYNHKNTGRPPHPDAPSIPSGTPLDPSGFFAAYLDEDHRPLFPFGFGLGYTRFEYRDLQLSASQLTPGGSLCASVLLSNAGHRSATEVVQLYVRDLVGSVTRPVRELKDFQRISLQPGESQRVSFELHTDALRFHDRHLRQVCESGRFELWIGPDSASGPSAVFELMASQA